MKKLMTRALTCAAAIVLSVPAFAAVSFSENFEGLNPEDPNALAASGWLVFGNVFWDYPGCSNYHYGYGPFPAPNGGAAFSNIVTGTPSGQALNVFSDYNNGDHAAGKCIESNVFQERVFNASDAGSYQFRFETQVPDPLQGDASTYGFVKLLDPNAGFATVLFEKVGTASAGVKTIDLILDSSADGKILQWGFASVSSNYEFTGRYYDNVLMQRQGGIPYDPELAVPTLNIPGLLLLLALVSGVGVAVLVRRS